MLVKMPLQIMTQYIRQWPVVKPALYRCLLLSAHALCAQYFSLFQKSFSPKMLIALLCVASSVDVLVIGEDMDSAIML